MARSSKLRTFSSTVSIYGGPSSGHFGHAGRTGYVGGSKPGKGGSSGGRKKGKSGGMTEAQRKAYNKKIDEKNERDRKKWLAKKSPSERKKWEKRHKEAEERGRKARKRLKDFEKDAGVSHDRAREIQIDKRGGRKTPNLTPREKRAIARAPEKLWYSEPHLSACNAQAGRQNPSEFIHSKNIVPMGENFNAQLGWY